MGAGQQLGTCTEYPTVRQLRLGMNVVSSYSVNNTISCAYDGIDENLVDLM